MSLTERLVEIADHHNMSAIDLAHAVNFERSAPRDAIAAARQVITEDKGYISESVIDDLLDELHDAVDNAND